MKTTVKSAFYRMIFVYNIDNKQLANKKSILSNTDDRDHHEQFYQRKMDRFTLQV